ncbi:MAG: hypothetical protein AAFY63_00115 [Cyanobacteria bacterium J06643_13]
MVNDSSVRDNSKLGVVIFDRVKPTEVKALAIGFREVYPIDKELVRM